MWPFKISYVLDYFHSGSNLSWDVEMLACLNPIPHGIFFSWLPRGGGIHPPYGKSTSECLSPILFYTVTYTYIRSSDPKGFFPSFKTLDLVADQSLAANSIYASNFWKSKIYWGKAAADFWGGRQKLTVAPRTLYFFFKGPPPHGE